jgi:hypothetical protein
MQVVEVQDALDVKHADLAVDYELLLLDLQRGLDNPRIAPSPVEPAFGEQLDPLPVADNAPAVAVVFDVVDPVVAGRKSAHE